MITKQPNLYSTVIHNNNDAYVTKKRNYCHSMSFNTKLDDFSAECVNLF